MKKTLEFARFLNKFKGFLLAEKEGFEPLIKMPKPLINQGKLKLVVF